MNRNLGRGCVKVVALSLFGASLFAIACSDTTPPPPRAAIVTALGPGPQAPASDCQLNTAPVIIMGDPENAQSVDNGSFGINSVDCTVAQSGANYAVSAQLIVKSKGSVTIQGTFKPLDKTKPAPQQANVPTDASGNAIPLTVVWNLADTGSFRETDCTAWYTNDQINPTTSTVLKAEMGVATGRFWATVYCPRALKVGDTTIHKACQAVGEFKLENCATQ